MADLRDRARGKIAYRIRTGKITRPEICELCGCDCKAVAHHEDYNYPLEVQWLCQSCHATIHWKSYREDYPEEWENTPRYRHRKRRCKNHGE